MTKIDEAAKILARGDLVVMRSDTVYGIFAAALDQKAAAKLRAVRERDFDSGRAFITLIDSVKSVQKMLDLSPEMILRLEKIWQSSAPTSIILNANNLQYVWLTEKFKGELTICLRVPHDETLRKLLKQTGPLCAPSANSPGQPPARNITEAKNYFGDAVSLYIDGGEVLENAAASRIIRLRADGFEEIVRQ